MQCVAFRLKMLKSFVLRVEDGLHEKWKNIYGTIPTIVFSLSSCNGKIMVYQTKITGVTLTYLGQDESAATGMSESYLGQGESAVTGMSGSYLGQGESAATGMYGS